MPQAARAENLSLGNLGKALAGMKLASLVTKAFEDGKITSDEVQAILAAFIALDLVKIPTGLLDKIEGFAPVVSELMSALADGKVTRIEFCDIGIALLEGVKAIDTDASVVATPKPHGGFGF